MNIIVADGCYDINVSPDKREVFLKDEPEVIKGLQVRLVEWFEDMQRVKAFEEPKQASITFEKKRAEPESQLDLQESYSQKRQLDP